MSIVFATMTIHPTVIEHLTAVGGTKLTVTHDEAATVKALSTADALICSDNAYLPGLAAAVKTAPKLRWLQLLTAGYDNTGRLGTPAGLTITNVGDAFSPSVAVHGFALMLALQRGIPTMLKMQPKHQWEKTIASRMVMPEGQTLLIVGYGSIGREVAKLAKPLGMKIIGLNRQGPSLLGMADPLADEIHTMDALHTQLPRADAIMLSLPLMPQTTKLIGAKELALCKPSALLVNVSRGLIVDTDALVAALNAGKLGGAGLDVTDPEPLPSGHQLWDAPNVIVSPHVAGAAGPYGVTRQAERAGANLKRYFAGEPVDHVIRL